VIVVYATAAFVILELVNNVFEPLRLPEWTPTLVIIIFLVGFPLAIIFSWIFDVTPKGIEKTKPVKEVQKGGRSNAPNSWRIATYVSVVIILGLVIFHILNSKAGSKEIWKMEKTIAVLPFENMSDDSEFAHLGDALTDEIIMQLYKINAFEVRSRTSIMQYKNSEKGSPIIGKELNVNYLLEGSTQRFEDQVRIRVQLIHASTDDHIWGDIFEGEWNDIFGIQINVAKQVARELKTVLSPEEVKRIEYEPTKNIEAYNLYLQGRYFYNQDSKEDLDKSLEFYNRALEIDPDYALAYTGIAASYTSYATSGYSPRKDVMYRAKKAAMKALEIDNTVGEAHAEMARARDIHDWDWLGAEKEFRLALELNPNYASGHAQYAWLLTKIGRHDEAIQECRRALELDPLSIGLWVSLGRRYYYARDFDRATEEYRKALGLFPNSGYARAELALALSLKGMYNEAIEEYSKVELDPNWHWHLGYIYGMAGNREEALNILHYYLELSEKEFVWPTNIAFIYAGLGEIDKAFEWLEKTYERREAWLDLLQVEPMYDNLRTDPRFQDLVERMNFP